MSPPIDEGGLCEGLIARSTISQRTGRYGALVDSRVGARRVWMILEETAMSGLIRKSLDAPEETRPFNEGKGKLDLVNLESGPVGRATFEPGWKWSLHVKPIAGTESCQAAHMGYYVSGQMLVRMDDGEEIEYGPGDFAVIPPGHDAWTIGDEACVVIDWQGFADYAKGNG
jgi:quercetin dioxygenase-like cupin family protein